MPQGDYIPRQDTIFQDWVGNFISVANLNLTALGLITTDMNGVTTDKTLFDTTITDNESKQAAAKAAAKKKQITRKALESKARALVKKIQAKVDVSADLKRQLQITVQGEGIPFPPVPFPPLDLVATIIGSGENELKWKRNNPAGQLMFIIEAKISNSPDFIYIASTTKTSYVHNIQPPGLKIFYRVKAQHNEAQSPPSNVAVINEGAVG